MKRVLIVNTTYTSFNGIASVIMNYVRKTYQSVNYDFVLCSKVEEIFVTELKNLGDKIYIPPCSRVKKPLKYSKWLKQIMRERKYDCIHVHGNSGTMYFEIHAAKQAGIPIRIAHSHNTSCKYKLAHKILKPLLNREMTDAIACSDLAGKWLFKRDFTVLNNGIDISKFLYSESTRDNYRNLLNLNDKFVIGHVAYMDTEKNHLYLLRVFREIVKDDTTARLLLIGDGRLRSEIEQYISDNNLSDYVLVLGKRADVAALYQCMDVFVLPSLYEGLPVTLIEAQSAGLPCVISDNITKQVDITGNIKYLDIHETNIRLWIKELSEHKQLNYNRLSCGERILKSNFNIDNCVSMLMKLYHKN